MLQPQVIWQNYKANTEKCLLQTLFYARINNSAINDIYIYEWSHRKIWNPDSKADFDGVWSVSYFTLFSCFVLMLYWYRIVSYCLTSNSRLVSGSGDIKLTKDGNVLLHEMVRLIPCSSFIDIFCILKVLCKGQSKLKEPKTLKNCNISDTRPNSKCYSMNGTKMILIRIGKRQTNWDIIRTPPYYRYSLNLPINNLYSKSSTQRLPLLLALRRLRMTSQVMEPHPTSSLSANCSSKPICTSVRCVRGQSLWWHMSKQSRKSIYRGKSLNQ